MRSPLLEIRYSKEARGRGDAELELRRAVRRGELVRLHRGAFVRADAWQALSREERHRHRAVAAARASRSLPTVSHRSALVLWGAPTVGELPPVIDVLSTPSSGSRVEGGFRRHATANPDFDVDERDGVAVTGLARTMAEFGSRASFRDAVVALDWAFRPATARSPKPVTDSARVLASADALGIRRGARILLRAVEFADGRSGSAGESVSRVAMHQLGLPQPELQTEFRDHGGLIGFVDFWWPQHGIVGEFDGVMKYRDEQYRGGRTASQVVVDEKLREDRLRAVPDVRSVTRWTWTTALDANALARQLGPLVAPRRNR